MKVDAAYPQQPKIRNYPVIAAVMGSLAKETAPEDALILEDRTDGVKDCSQDNNTGERRVAGRNP